MYKRALILLVVLLIVIAGSITWYKKFHSVARTQVVSEYVDLKTAKGEDRLPKGFPKEIPVDLSNVRESYSYEYKEYNLLQSGFTFMSQQTKNDAYDSYLTYIANAGYTIDTKYTNKEAGYISGKRGDETLSFAITEINKSVQVQVVYSKKL